MRIIRAACLFLPLSVGALAQDIDFDQIQIETVPVTESIHMLSGGGGNIGVLVGGDGMLLIDTMFSELDEKIQAAISTLDKGSVRFVLNTNWHYDHVSGNVTFAGDGATIIAHEKTRDRMATEQYHPFFDMRIPPYPPASLPSITISSSMTLHVNGEEIHAFHIESAHSDADLAFFFRNANVPHTGDLYFAKGYPFIDYNHGGSIDGMIAAADKLLDMIDDETKIIPGHGPLSSREELQEYKQMLVTVRDRIARQIEEGKSLEEITTSKPTSDFDAGREVGMAPDEFVRIVYDDLTSNQ
jgi:glyoxylase-like metal-dependent hydrolase (beta-lactamase superfamily II)